MIGKYSIEIGARSDGGNDFVNGIASKANMQDGGFSPETTQINPIAVPGVLHAPGAITDKSGADLTDEIIASCEDPSYNGLQRVFLDDGGDFYSWDGTTLTLVKSASADLFEPGTTDFVPWNNTAGGLNFYATTKAGAGGDIVKWNKSTTLDEAWWLTTLGQAALLATTAWRPLLVYETFLFVGDGKLLHRIDIALTVSNSILTLGADENISALGKDNGSGKMLIATTTSVDYSASRNGKSKIYYYDGYSNKAIKACEVNGLITSFLSVGDNVYVFYGNKVGLFTGSGIRFLRTLDFAIGAAASLIYPHRRCVIDNTIYIAQNWTALAYGPLVTGGQNVFYPALTPDTSSKKFTILCPLGGNKLGYSHETNKFYTHDITSIAAVISGGASFYSRRYFFPRPVWIRNVRVEFDTPVTAAAGDASICTVRLIDDTGTDTLLKTISQHATLTQPYVDTGNANIKTHHFQLRCTIAPSTATLVFGIRRFIIYYDVAE